MPRYAGMAELADAQDLGSCGQPCGFDPHYPYQRGAGPNFFGSSIIFYLSNPVRYNFWSLFKWRSKANFAPPFYIHTKMNPSIPLPHIP